MRDSDAELKLKFERFLKLEAKHSDWSCAEMASRIGVVRGTIFRWRKKISVQVGSAEPIHTICFDVPMCVAEEFAELCKREGMRKSERLRDMVMAELEKDKKTRARRS